MAENNLQILLNSGFDAFSNLYDVEITIPTSAVQMTTGIASTYQIRVKDFQPPSITLGEYQNHFKTVDITRLNAQFSDTREFSLRFRIDSEWSLYTSLKNWKMLYTNIAQDKVNFGLYSETINNQASYGIVKVSPYGSSAGLSPSGTKNTTLTWIYNDVILYDVIEPQFQRGTSSPIEVECKFLFGRYAQGAS